jgi:hypothetical protein
MEIEIINTTSIEIEQIDLSNTKYFALILLKTLSSLKMLHWYTNNFNYHSIIGDLYESLDTQFDKLLEEIIGTSSNVCFPAFSPDSINTDDILDLEQDLDSFIDQFNKISTILKAYLNSPEFYNYTSAVPSGLNNTKEEILSAINKASYLINMLSNS